MYNYNVNEMNKIVVCIGLRKLLGLSSNYVYFTFSLVDSLFIAFSS